MTRYLVPLFCVVCALPLSGEKKPARRYAEILAAYTNNVKENGEQFASFRDQLAKVRLRNINMLERSALETENDIATVGHVWEIAGDTNRIHLFGSVLAAADEAVKQHVELQSRRLEQANNVENTKAAVRIRSEQLAKAANSLGQLADKPDLKSRLGFFVVFAREVRDSIQEGRKDAEAEVDEGVKQAETKEQDLASQKAREDAEQKAREDAEAEEKLRSRAGRDESTRPSILRSITVWGSQKLDLVSPSQGGEVAKCQPTKTNAARSMMQKKAGILKPFSRCKPGSMMRSRCYRQGKSIPKPLLTSES